MKKLFKIKLNDFNEISNAEMKKIVGGNVDCGEGQTLFHCTGTTWEHDHSGYACGTNPNDTAEWLREGFVNQACFGAPSYYDCVTMIEEANYQPKCK